MNVKHYRRAARALTLVAIGSTSTAVLAQTPATSLSVWRFDEAVTYPIVPHEIAFLGRTVRSGAPVGLEDVADAFIDAHSGWSMMSVNAVRAGIDARGMVESALSAELGEYAAPILLTDQARGLRAAPTPVLLVCFNDGLTDAERRAALKAAGLTGDEAIIPWSNIPSIAAIPTALRSGFAVLDAAAALSQSGTVRFAEPDMLYEGVGDFTPNDPEYVAGNQWGLHNTGQLGGVADMDVDAPEAWDTTTGVVNVRVLVIDTGVQRDHPDLIVDFGVDVTSDGPGDGSPRNSFDNHGTPVAGLIGATLNNGLGVAGVAAGARLGTARTFIAVNAGGGWTSSASWTVDTLDWAVTENVRITNNSNFYGFTSAAIETAYASTRTSNQMLHFAIAGNDASMTVAYPGRISAVHAIGAIDRTGTRASFSNVGPEVALAGPGVATLTTDRTGTDGYNAGDLISFGGTSAATPFVAGVAALILSAEPTLTLIQAETALFGTTKDLGPSGRDDEYGEGLPSAADAIATIPNIIDPPPTSCELDVIDDAAINGVDLALLLAHWGNSPGSPADLDGNGVVGGSDLAILLARWGPCE